MAYQIGNPLCIFYIRLTSGNSFDMLRIHNHDRYLFFFKYIIYRFPIRARTFHGSHLTICFFQPRN
ncbi:hypothetical protein EUBVEN_02565 [Eubacterium ventriosum ATCC 27560]|uniref:Uncharacterized protein n=1 Tax=Eubacterium ventriosum ATCC 27560 TaxID=411463 RepID=A5ZA17_9FIRM|nr:hypothetical protein EUBVEN_02565 [Eubacterium ventriosum ATCC 27560]